MHLHLMTRLIRRHRLRARRLRLDFRDLLLNFWLVSHLGMKRSAPLQWCSRLSHVVVIIHRWQMLEFLRIGEHGSSVTVNPVYSLEFSANLRSQATNDT